MEHGGDVRLDGNETVVVGLFKVIDDGRDVGLALAREDVFRFYLIIDGITTVLDVDVDDVLTHRLVELPRSCQGGVGLPCEPSAAVELAIPAVVRWGSGIDRSFWNTGLPVSKMSFSPGTSSIRRRVWALEKPPQFMQFS